MKFICLLIACLFFAGCSTTSNQQLGDTPGTGYTVIFDGFTPNTVFEFEDTLTRFSEYRTHKLVYASERSGEHLYTMALTPSQMRDSLRTIAERLELNVLIRYMDGQKFELKKVR
ncbi:MAG: hypothetical protein ACRBCI_11550 [Cellvibrionaceae bacterium]